MSELGEYQLLRTKRRTLSLHVSPKAILMVRAPEKLSLKTIENFIHEKRGWILKKQEIARNRLKEKVDKKFEDGEEFVYLGKTYKLFLAFNLEKPVLFKDDEFLLDTRRRENARNHFKTWYKEAAADFIEGRVKMYAQACGLEFEKISIRHGKQRLGSCGARGELNFSWRLILAPVEAIDYVVAHELAHLKERNHSARFWQRVREIYPDFLAGKKWLRTHAHSLDI